MALHDLLYDLNQKMGTDLKLDQQKSCRFEVNGQLSVALEESVDGQHFYLFAVIGVIDKQYEEKVFQKALEGNLFGIKTAGNSIGYDADARALVLFRRFRNEVDFQYFFSELEHFSGVLKVWKEWMSEWASGARPEDEIKDARIESVLKRQKLKIFMA